VTFTIAFTDAGDAGKAKKPVHVDTFGLTNIGATGAGLPVTQRSSR
jgi:hypothetical protein